MPHLAMKFFVPRETRDALMARPAIRRDRLTDQAVTVKWDRPHLKRLLDARLAVYSTDEEYGSAQVHDLTQVCEDSWVTVGREQAPQRLAEWMEDEMLRLAQGSPRRLLTAGQLLCEAHMRRHGPSGFLRKADWEEAKARLIQKMPPLLRIQRDSLTASVGDREIRLTPQQQHILLVLAASHGLCDREVLVSEVWGTPEGIGEAAIDQAVRRLRERLGDDQVNPVYLRTERGRGFRLLNYEVV
jgi:hypothetical protein